jgi:hypothetical protein
MKIVPQNEFQFQPKLTNVPATKINLSRLPKLPARQKFELPSKAVATASGCAGCGGRVDRDDNFQQSVKVCRKCLAHYAKIDTAIDEASKRKRRELLEKFAGVE